MSVRKEIARIGKRGAQARVVIGTVRGAPCYVVEYRQRGKRKRAFFAYTRPGKVAAIAFAEGAMDPTPAAVPTVTLEGLFRAFAQSEFRSLRLNTRRIYTENWGHFERRAGPHTLADDAGMETCRKVCDELEAKGLAVNTIAGVFRTVRRVYRFGQEHELVQKARPLNYRYKVGKDQKPEIPAEYRGEEFRAILAQLPLEGATTWRAHAALALCGYQGVRQNAALHLKWSDVDFVGERIVWRAEFDKMGREWDQPLRKPVLELLAHLWTHRADGEWVFPASRKDSKSPVYSIQSLWLALVKAEKRAGITALKGRAGHGLRRMLAGDVAEVTGNATLGLQAIGDTDLRMAGRYVKKREDAMADAFERLDARDGNRTATRPTGDNSDAS
jgi:integrase